MDTLTFIVEITKAATWPIAMVVVALIFKDQIKDLSDRVKKGKLGPAEFEFEQKLKQLESIAEIHSDEEPQISRTSVRPSFSLKYESPRELVLNKWFEVEPLFLELATKQGFQPTFPSRKYLHAMQYVIDNDLLPKNLARVSRGLLDLRNQAAHEHNFSPSQEALEKYIDLAKAVSSAVRSAIDSQSISSK